MSTAHFYFHKYDLYNLLYDMHKTHVLI